MDNEEEAQKLVEMRREIQRLLNKEQGQNSRIGDNREMVNQTDRSLVKVTRNQWKSDIKRLEDVRQHMINQKQESEVLAEVRQMLIDTLTILESHNVGRQKRTWYSKLKCW